MIQGRSPVQEELTGGMAGDPVAWSHNSEAGGGAWAETWDHVGTLGQFRKGFGGGCTGPTPKGEMVTNDFPRLVLMQPLLVPQQQTWSIPLPLGTGEMLSFEDIKVLQGTGNTSLCIFFPTTMVSGQVCLITFFFPDSLIT